MLINQTDVELMDKRVVANADVSDGKINRLAEVTNLKLTGKIITVFIRVRKKMYNVMKL